MLKGARTAMAQAAAAMARLRRHCQRRPPDFRETVQRKGNSQIRRVIAEGKGTMPAFDPALRPSEINDMLQMVRFLSREGRDLAWWEKYDTLIAAHCSIPWEAALGLDDEPEKKP